MFGLGAQELLVILVIVLILFGANRLPQLAKSLGSSLKEFKKGVNEAQTDESSAASKNGQNPVVVAAAPKCAGCQTPLAAEWKHCPRCGAPVTTEREL
jgi:sec-independent protein translocase protein TatA